MLRRRIDGVPFAIIVAGVVIVACAPLYFRQPFPQHVLIMSMLFASLGIAWNILGGYAGQVSFGHSVYFGIGAYTAAWCYVKLGLTVWVASPFALAIAAVVAIVVGAPTFRLRGHYFVLATVFIAESIFIIVTNWDAVGGAIGLEMPVLKTDDGMARLWHAQFATKLPYYYAMLAILLCAVAIAWRIERAPLGFYLRAIREEQDAALSLGIDVARQKLAALMVSAAISVVCGLFYAQYVLYVEPVSTISILISLEIAFIAILGGIGTLWGPVIGAFIVVPLTELLRSHFSGRIALDQSRLAGGDWTAWLDYYLAGGGGNVDLLFYGALIMLIARFQPRGVLGFFRKLD